MAYKITELTDQVMYYVWGNTPPVCLTQDLPPEQDADILLLGCGDARHLLFTCYTDGRRKIDVTCCDVEPGIHARNIVLYTLLMEDNANCNIDRIWNIYYHWKIDNASLELLETQVEKLLKVSKSIDEWHVSVYGMHIRFCDAQSLALVRSYWLGFSSRNVSPLEKQRRLSQLHAAIDRARSFQKRSWFGYVSPETALVLRVSLQELMKEWWDHGTMPSLSRSSSTESADLNPMLLYSPNDTLMLSISLIPLTGFSLSTSCVPTPEGSVFNQGEHVFAHPKSLVAGAQTNFSLWASAFRGASKNQLMMRIFCGDALAFCSTLRNHQLSGARSMNLFKDGQTNTRLELHAGDYGQDQKAAPVTFDVIDTSNIVDHVGSLTVIATASSLLKNRVSSCLYTETIGQLDSSLAERLLNVFGVDVRTMSLLLGLALPDLFTNATDKAEDEVFIENIQQVQGGLLRCSRLRWKRIKALESEDIPSIQVEAKALAKLVAQMHDAIVSPKTKSSWLQQSFPRSGFHDGSAVYNQASFALFLYHLQATVFTDWAQCIEYFYESRLSLDSVAPSLQDLLLNMHTCGVDNGTFHKPESADVNNAVLAPILPICEGVPDQLCVTVRVAREKLKVLMKGTLGSPALICSFEGGDPGAKKWSHTYSSVQIAFGKWHEPTNKDSYPLIQEDNHGLTGTSDMFVSVFVPTWMLLSSKRSMPMVMCGFVKNEAVDDKFLEDLGPKLCLIRCKMTCEDVFVTKYMPGMPGLPTFAQQNKPTSATTIVRLTDDGSKVSTLTRRLTLKSEPAKTKLADKSSTVEIEFKTPFAAVISIAQSLKLELEFPVPVSPTCNVRIGRKSSYIEIEATLFNPLTDNTESLFLYPTFMTKDQLGVAVPTLWASTRIDLDVMPPIDLSDKHAIDFLVIHLSLMFSTRERRIRVAEGVQADVRTNLKDQLLGLFVRYMGLQGKQADVFAISTHAGIKMLIMPACVRLDLVNHTIVLDAAMVPVLGDEKVTELLRDLSNNGAFGEINVNEADYCAWDAMMPALAERCRTSIYQHVLGCKYAQACEVPKCENGSAICSCGVGKFPENYLKMKCDAKMSSGLDYLLRCCATRVAIAPIFTVSFVEECFLKGMTRKDIGEWALLRRSLDNCPRCVVPSTTGPIFAVDYAHCRNCGKNRTDIVQAGGRLLRCSKCKLNQYCSEKCQRSDWKNHKPACLLQS